VLASCTWMEFRILGPLEVFEDGQKVNIGGPKQRALLAALALLLNANRAVTADGLIDALWASGRLRRRRKRSRSTSRGCARL
jgi:DNA-binding SARP family transcriptional activator